MVNRRTVTGTAKNDRLQSSVAAVINGLGGQDEITGSDFSDLINAGPGTDRVLALGGNDRLIHDMAVNFRAEDQYDGGAGQDTLLIRGTWKDYLSAPVQALAGSNKDSFKLLGMRAESVENVLFTLPIMGEQDLSTDSPVIVKAERLQVNLPVNASRFIPSVSLLRNDEVKDLVRSVTLLSPIKGASLEVDLDPTDKTVGQSAVLFFDPGTAFNGLKPGQTVQRAIKVLITDADGDRAESSVFVTIRGRQQSAAVIIGTAAATLTEDTPPGEASGKLKITDLNPGEAQFRNVVSEALAGDYGLFTFNAATGAWGYKLDPAKVQALKAGQTAVDDLPVVSADGLAKATIAVTLQGSNDKAVIKAESAAVTQGSTTPVQGAVTVTDADAGQGGVIAIPKAQVSAFGSFTMTDQGNGKAAYSYLLDAKDPEVLALKANESLTDTLNFQSLDGTRGVATVTIYGKTPAVFAGTNLVKITEDAQPLTAGGTLTVKDVNPGEATFKAPAPASLKGKYGDFTFNDATGAWTYTADNNRLQPLEAFQTAYDNVKIFSADGSFDFIEAEIKGVNDVPLLTGLTGTIQENATAPLKQVLTITDKDAGDSRLVNSTQVTQVEYGEFVINDSGSGKATWSFTLKKDDPSLNALWPSDVVKQTAEFSTIDGTKGTLTVTVIGENDKPTGDLFTSGTPGVNNQLFVARGQVYDFEGVTTFAWQWLRNGQEIVGATDDEYYPKFSDIGAEISVRGSYRDEGGTLETVTASFGTVPDLSPF